MLEDFFCDCIFSMRLFWQLLQSSLQCYCILYKVGNKAYVLKEKRWGGTLCKIWISSMYVHICNVTYIPNKGVSSTHTFLCCQSLSFTLKLKKLSISYFAFIFCFCFLFCLFLFLFQFLFRFLFQLNCNTVFLLP